MRSRVESAARTIEHQASRLGYEVEAETAGTGTTYLTVEHPALAGDRLIRVADHEPNEARYKFRINREPDLCVDAGFQVAAVRRLAEWIGIEPTTVPYLKAAATRAAKAAAAAAAHAAKMEAERLAFLAEMRRRYDSASPEDRRKADHYEKLHGAARKRYRKRHGEALRRAGAVVNRGTADPAARQTPLRDWRGGEEMK